MINKRLITLGLSILGICGTGATAFFAIKGHDKVKDICDDKMDKKQKVITYAKCYVPAVACFVGTSACVLGANHISSKEIAALTASCTYLATNRDKIEKKIKERFGEEKLKEIKGEIGKEEAVKHHAEKTCKSKKLIPDKSSVEWTGGGTLKCFEGYSGRLFYSSLERVKEAEAKLNRRLHDGEYVSLNDFYDLLGISKTHFGNTFGWPANEDYYDIQLEEPIGFENTIVEDDFTGEPLLIIDVYTYPMECWDEV